jgi:beta-lactam-binding protein with PASTA domain/tRNA A-37 threonylcarbamoyl transferase component Bud32
MIEDKHIFNNRYRPDTKLGEGGMAIVYSGTDTLLRRRVAIKVLHPQYASDEEFVRRFYQEAESAAKLSHPNIVNTYDVGREGQTYYIVMELVDGPSLAEVIAADGRLPEPVAIDYAAQICNGLAYAHRQGLLHRDIKPANILITKDDVVKLSDFGIARAVSQHTMAMTRPGLVMGSVFYLSPEQAQGLEMHETSDLYSVGIVLYQMLTGRLPYTGESPVTVALKHVSDPVPTLDTSESGVGVALGAIVNKLLQKQPEHRFQSASDVASALREARERPHVAGFAHADDAPTKPIPTVAVQPPPRPSRMPDRPPERTVEADEPPRSGARLASVLVFLALLAAAVGAYFALVHPAVQTPQIALDNYVGMSDAQAQQAIVNAGLNYKLYRTSSATVAVNHVVRQRPAQGTMLKKGAVIDLVVSTGMPTVGLRDVTGYMLADAQKDLQYDKLGVKVIQKYAAAANGEVIAQSPKPGSKLREGSTVTLTVSQGPAPIAMPKLVGLSIDRARALAAKLGFRINVSQTSEISNIPPNVIASQDVRAGQMVPADGSAAVNVVVSTGGGLAQIPDVRGVLLQQAEQEITQAGFVPTIGSYAEEPDSPDNGKVLTEDPQGVSMAEKGTQVQLTVSVPGEVPDTEGMALSDARAVLIDNGYTIGNLTPTSEGADGKVVRTEPEAGTGLRPGSPVNIFINNATASGQP